MAPVDEIIRTEIEDGTRLPMGSSRSQGSQPGSQAVELPEAGAVVAAGNPNTQAAQPPALRRRDSEEVMELAMKRSLEDVGLNSEVAEVDPKHAEQQQKLLESIQQRTLKRQKTLDVMKENNTSMGRQKAIWEDCKGRAQAQEEEDLFGSQSQFPDVGPGDPAQPSGLIAVDCQSVANSDIADLDSLGQSPRSVRESLPEPE